MMHSCVLANIPTKSKSFTIILYVPATDPFPKRLSPGKDLPEGVTMMFNELTQWFRWNFQVGAPEMWRGSCKNFMKNRGCIYELHNMNIFIKHVWICGWFKMKTQTFWSFGSINPGVIFFMIFQCRCFCRTVNRGLAYHECRVRPWCRGVGACASLEIRIASEGVQIWLKFLEEG